MIRRTVYTLKKLPTRVRSRMSHHLISPRAVLDELDVQEGDTVLELGNPTGFFAQTSLQSVGEPGRVIVAGPNQASFDRIAHLARYRQLETVLLADVLLGRAFEYHSVDWVILTNLLSSSMHPDHFCLSIGNYLKKTGQVVLLDWDTALVPGPDSARRVSREDAVRLLAGCGMTFTRTLKTPGYHYGLVFKLKAPVH